MVAFLTVIHVILCIGLILSILLQSSKGGGLAGMFGGGGGAGRVVIILATTTNTTLRFTDGRFCLFIHHHHKRAHGVVHNNMLVCASRASSASLQVYSATNIPDNGIKAIVAMAMTVATTVAFALGHHLGGGRRPGPVRREKPRAG